MLKIKSYFDQILENKMFLNYFPKKIFFWYESFIYKLEKFIEITFLI